MSQIISFFNKLWLVLAICVVATMPAYSKARPPDTGLGILKSDVIAVIKVTSVVPAPGSDSGNGYYGCVQVTILETIKGKLTSKKVSIFTKRWGRGAEEWADAGAFCPEHIYLVFLKRNGTVYNAYFGSFGVFPIDDKCRVSRWSKPGVKPPIFPIITTTSYNKVKQQVKKYMGK